MHPWLGTELPVCNVCYRHRSSDWTLSEVVKVDVGDFPAGEPFLMRPERFGGEVLKDELEFFVEDPWGRDDGETPAGGHIMGGSPSRINLRASSLLRSPWSG